MIKALVIWLFIVVAALIVLTPALNKIRNCDVLLATVLSILVLDGVFVWWLLS